MEKRGPLTPTSELSSQIALLRAQLEIATKEKNDQQAQYQRRIDFLERQVDVLKRGRGSNRRRSSSMSSDGGSGDWTMKPDFAARSACSVVSERDTIFETKRTWRDMWKNLWGKRSRDSEAMRSSIWEAKVDNGRIVFVDPEAKPSKKQGKKRRGISGESDWV
ncbi:unnamed protein product [Aphanomyces euteiches]|uniref:Uncharacterized protein n=1 Tax=Aphanomyces euteiches TaxID=100861 RepID=A0A6G0X1L1_9STRA|nr:hypothetical protein Ae201684_009505 [Aphanomyces euteiches]KAH9085288.1 hypothetical protein Ae201684P_004998 [Aphanomyces euteiches]KAH9136853.1 hypothetical protein AeRB84_018185 [Aphanomyces euteiches]